MKKKFTYKKGGKTDKVSKYKVLRNYAYGWDDGFFSDDNGEVPTLFDSKKEAEDDIKEHIEDIKSAIKSGNMDEDSLELREDFKIVPSTDRSYGKGGKVTLYHEDARYVRSDELDAEIDKRDALKLLKKGLIQPEDEPDEDNPLYTYHGDEDSYTWERFEKELGYIPIGKRERSETATYIWNGTTWVLKHAKGGEVKKKGNEMIMGGLAGVLLGFLLNK